MIQKLAQTGVLWIMEMQKTRFKFIVSLALSALACGSTAIFAQQNDDLDDNYNEEGYRSAHYRGRVDKHPDGAEKIALPAAIQLWKGRQAIFVDVMPAEGAFRDPETGQWHLAKERRTISGSLWFPEAGRGELDDNVSEWFKSGIERATHGKKNAYLVIFCLADCWMSWNASRRLAADGYTNVYWLAEGTDGWSDMDLPLVSAQPEA